jgi:hypothetical protein
MVFCAVVCVTAFITASGALIKVNDNTKGVWGPYEPYEQVADWIYSQESSHQPDTLVIMTGGGAIGQNYYITHDGQRPPLNMGTLTYDNYEQYNTVYLFEGHDYASQTAQEILAEHYIVVEEREYEVGAGHSMVVYVYARKYL